MRRRHLLFAHLIAALAVAVTLAGGATATPRAAACDPQGAWVARGPEIARYLAAVNPTLVRITVLGGTMTMRLRSDRWTVRTANLRVTGAISASTSFTETIAIDLSAPYTLTGSRLRLGQARSSLAIRGATITTNGKTQAIPDPAPEVESLAGRTVAYRCVGDRLTFAIPTPGRTATLSFTRP